MVGDIERVAIEAYRIAGIPMGERVQAVLLAQRILGKDAVREVPERIIGGPGALVRVETDWRIYLRRESPIVVKRFTLLHELSHYLLGPSGSESECDQLAAALLLPRTTLHSVAAQGPTVAKVARAFGASETCTWRRLGEVQERFVAVVTPERVYKVKASEALDESEARFAAKHRGRIPGLHKCRLRDDPLRTAMCDSR